MGLLLDDESVIHKPKPVPGGGGSVEGFLFRIFNIQVSHYGADWGPHSCTLNLFIEFILKRKVCIMQTEA